MDSETYIRILKLLNDNYLFNPKVIHTDYESALDKAIKESSFYKNKPINIKCFFHFVKLIKNKILTIEHNKKGIKKLGINILNNIEIISFIDINKMDDYKNFLINEIKKYNNYDSLINYLKSYWFKKIINNYNYSCFIKKYLNNKKALDELCVTNNIIESLHSKLNYYLPRHVTNQYNFINVITNILINDSIINSSIIRKDIKTKTLLYIIDKDKLNSYFKWIDEKIFKLYLKKILNDNFDYDNEEESNKLISLNEEEEVKVISEKEGNNNEIIKSNNINILDDNSNESEMIIEYDNKIEEQSLDNENINRDKNIIDEDLNNNNCDELIKLIDVINLNTDDINIQKNTEHENKIEEEKSQNDNENNSNNIDSNLMVPLRERVKNKILYPKSGKRKKSYDSEESIEYHNKKKKKSVSKMKKNIKVK